MERIDFVSYSHPYRARSVQLNAAISVTTTATAQLADAGFLLKHDVLELVDSATGSSEFVQLSADPTNVSTVAITRGVASTTPLQTITSGSTCYLIGNSRSGDEINQTAITTLGTARTQYCQTFQHPVDIGGSAQTARAQVFPGGMQTPFDFNMTMSLQNMVDDIEETFYYGKAQAPVDGTTPTTAKMNGLKAILTTNNVTTPTNASAYTSIDMIRDTLQAARTGGGEPDLLVLSTNFMSGFSTWGHAVQRIPAGETDFGTPILTFEAPFLHGVSIVEAPLLRPYTAIALTSSEVFVRYKRAPYFQPRGILGDRVQADWIAEMAIECVNQQHHAWLEGISAFSPN